VPKKNEKKPEKKQKGSPKKSKKEHARAASLQLAAIRLHLFI